MPRKLLLITGFTGPLPAPGLAPPRTPEDHPSDFLLEEMLLSLCSDQHPLSGHLAGCTYCRSRLRRLFDAGAEKGSSWQPGVLIGFANILVPLLLAFTQPEEFEDSATPFGLSVWVAELIVGAAVLRHNRRLGRTLLIAVLTSAVAMGVFLLAVTGLFTFIARGYKN